MAKKPNYRIDRVYRESGEYVRCWKERREWVVQVWLSGKADGEPDGDWAFDGRIGTDAAVDQTILNTRSDKK